MTCGIDLAVKAGYYDFIEMNGIRYQEYGFEAASLFSFVAMIIYGYDAYLKIRN